MTDAPLVDSARIFALIPAAGVGRRMGADCPKQYMPIAGVPMLVRTVEALLAASRVERVFVVVSPEDAYIDHAACRPKAGGWSMRRRVPVFDRVK